MANLEWVLSEHIKAGNYYIEKYEVGGLVQWRVVYGKGNSIYYGSGHSKRMYARWEIENNR